MELWIKPIKGTTYGGESLVNFVQTAYMKQISEHNKKVIRAAEGREYADSGFDLYIPWNPNHKEGKWVFPGHTTVRIPLGIKMVNRNSCVYTGSGRNTSPFYIYARSSISKTPLRLANNQGIIDAGYRGELMVALDNIVPKQWLLNPGIRLVQVCRTDLSPFKVKIVDEDFEATERGSGGFGSTGH